jgi:hypothetical protein
MTRLTKDLAALIASVKGAVGKTVGLMHVDIPAARCRGRALPVPSTILGKPKAESRKLTAQQESAATTPTLVDRRKPETADTTRLVGQGVLRVLDQGGSATRRRAGRACGGPLPVATHDGGDAGRIPRGFHPLCAYAGRPSGRWRGLPAWTGAWTGARGTPSVPCALLTFARGIVAGQAHVANECASHNLPVVGSSPTRPTLRDSQVNHP